jgi:hypothetical protein
MMVSVDKELTSEGQRHRVRVDGGRPLAAHHDDDRGQDQQQLGQHGEWGTERVTGGG